MVFLKWKEERLKIIPILGKDGEIENNVILFPNWNFVSDEVFAKIKNSVENDSRFEILDSVKVKDKEGKTTNEKIKEFKQIPNQQAVEIVRGMFNLVNLDTWLENESRDEVRAEIKKKIEEITKK